MIRNHYLPRADAKAWALYLVLVSVSDEHGLSYYGDGTLSRLLSLTLDEVLGARRQLETLGVIAYEKPLYQVLSLEGRP